MRTRKNSLTKEESLLSFLLFCGILNAITALLGRASWLSDLVVILSVAIAVGLPVAIRIWQHFRSATV